MSNRQTSDVRKGLATKRAACDYPKMQPNRKALDLPGLTERLTVVCREGTKDVLVSMAGDGGYGSLGEYMRAIFEREIATCRPEDFKRLRGVA